MKAIRVISDYREYGYIDFEILDANGESNQNLYRYYNGESGFSKVYGFSGYGKAIRGKARKLIEQYIKTVYENNVPFAIIG